MNHGYSLLRVFKTIGLMLALGVNLSVEAGLFGIGGTHWKEEVLLHDGQKIVVQRSQSYGGRHEIGQKPPIKEQEIAFTVPATKKSLTFTSEYSEDIGRTNFILLALHILNDTPYLVAEPNLCLAYNKWGRPNPPYVIFKHDGKAWQRIPLSDLPIEFKDINLVISTKNKEKTLTAEPLVTAERIKKLNGQLTQPEYKTILREEMKNAGGSRCGEMVSNGKGKWLGIGWFREQPSYEACVKYCERENFDAQHCPCKTIFNGAK